MAELEKIIEDKLIEQLTKGKSQWTYRPDMTTEDALWNNLRKILENGNKDKLNDKPLTDREFEQVKNQLSFATFYDAAKKNRQSKSTLKNQYISVIIKGKSQLLSLLNS